MGSEDWYRNSSWDESVAAAFDAKLKRARRKAQYLRIQASYLVSRHPEVALRLLDRYFELDDHFDDAQAHVDRATAWKALKQPDRVVEAYEAALKREQEFSNLKTVAYVEFPFFVAMRELVQHYSRALEVLEANREEPLFPVERFKWHSAMALILAATGRIDVARAAVKEAFEDAAKDDTGFRYHPKVGLVSDMYNPVLEKLKRIGQ